MAAARVRTAAAEWLVRLAILPRRQGDGTFLVTRAAGGPAFTIGRGSGEEFGGNGDDAMWCGRGDKKTRRGKRFKGSFGNARPSKGADVRRLRHKWQIPPGEPLPSLVQ